MAQYFVGRENEIEAFKHCLNSQSQNGIYYHGSGGIGKTLLLQKIFAVSQEELDAQALFIDFFSTKSRSIEGLQNTIIEQLESSQAFREIFETRQKLEELRAGSTFSYRQELISSLQKQNEVMFARCCNEAARKQRIVLVFDSFEYVQTRDVGRWFLRDFLPSLRGDDPYTLCVVLPDSRSLRSCTG